MLMLVAVLGLAAILMHVFRPLQLQNQYDLRTRKQLVLAHDALFGYALANGRLPRPARSALDGRERADECTSAADCTGLLPWVALGINSLDGWGHLLHYSVTLDMTHPQVTRNVVPDKVVLQQDQEGNLRYLVGQETCSQALLCSPAVVFSSGGAGGISATGMMQIGDTRPSAVVSSNLSATQQFYLPKILSDSDALHGPQLLWLDTSRLLRRMDDARLLR